MQTIRIAFLMVMASLFAFPGWAGAQVESAPSEAAEAARKAVEEAEAAEREAKAARAFADALAKELDERSAAEATPDGSASGARGEGGSILPAELEEAVRKAEKAADDAWMAARAAQRARQKPARAPGFDGPYFGAAFVYAAEDFEDSIVVKSSLAGAAFAGYRFGDHFAVDVRYERFESFDLKASNGRGEIDGYALTLNAKAFPIRGPIQPFLGFGIGGIQLESDIVLDSGQRFSDNEGDVVFRFFGGLDLPLTDHLILNTEAAYLAPGNDLTDFEIIALSAGLTFVF